MLWEAHGYWLAGHEYYPLSLEGRELERGWNVTALVWGSPSLSFVCAVIVKVMSPKYPLFHSNPVPRVIKETHPLPNPSPVKGEGLAHVAGVDFESLLPRLWWFKKLGDFERGLSEPKDFIGRVPQRPTFWSSAGNKRQGGSLFFGYFLLAKQKKVTRQEAKLTPFRL